MEPVKEQPVEQIQGRFGRGESTSTSLEQRIARFERIVVLTGEGKTLREIADLIGITPQRVHVILVSGPPGLGGRPVKKT